MTLVTFASMIQTDGKTTVTGIYRGALRSRNGKPFINLNDKHCQQIATETEQRGIGIDHLTEVDRLAVKHATAEFPAVNHRLQIVDRLACGHIVTIAPDGGEGPCACIELCAEVSE